MFLPLEVTVRFVSSGDCGGLNRVGFAPSTPGSGLGRVLFHPYLLQSRQLLNPITATIRNWIESEFLANVVGKIIITICRFSVVYCSGGVGSFYFYSMPHYTCQSANFQRAIQKYHWNFKNE